MSEIREDLIIIKVTREWLENSSYSKADFALKMLAQELKLVEPQAAEDFINWRGALQKRVCRILSGEQPFPLQWKWSWIDALPSKPSRECKLLLASAAGYIDTMPSIKGEESNKAETADLMRQFSNVLDCNAPAHDGVYDENDDINESNDLIDAHLKLAASAVREARRIHNGTGATGKVYNIADIQL